MIDCYGIPTSQINNIKMGADWVADDGTVVPNGQLVTPADPPRSFAYCSDTKYIPTLHQCFPNVSLLYHESTYDQSYEALAEKYFHSTAAQAAMVARDAGASQLMIGHYSSRFNDEQVLLDEAKAIFHNTILAQEGLVVDVR